MPAPLTVIIPTLEASHRLPGCASALLEGVSAGLIARLILVDGGSADGIAEMAERLGAELLSMQPSRGGQLRAGCAEARTPWLLVLHADTQLAPGWAEAVGRHIRERPDRAGWFRLRFDAGGAWVARWANWRSRWLGLPYGDQGLLIPTKLYEAVGGYPDQPLMEDVAIARALRGKLVPLDAVAVTSAEKYRREGWLRRGARNLFTLLRYLAGVSPARLAAGYRR